MKKLIVGFIGISFFVHAGAGAAVVVDEWGNPVTVQAPEKIKPSEQPEAKKDQTKKGRLKKIIETIKRHKKKFAVGAAGTALLVWWLLRKPKNKPSEKIKRLLPGALREPDVRDLNTAYREKYVGFHQEKSWKGTMDDVLILKEIGIGDTTAKCFAVLDGHQGSLVSDFVGKRLAEVLSAYFDKGNVAQSVKRAFTWIDKEIKDYLDNEGAEIIAEFSKFLQGLNSAATDTHADLIKQWTLEKERTDSRFTQFFRVPDNVDEVATAIVAQETIDEKVQKFVDNYLYTIGSSAAVVLATPTNVYCINLGNSRILLSIDSKAVQLVQDHGHGNVQEYRRLNPEAASIDITSAGLRRLARRLNLSLIDNQEGLRLSLSRSFGYFGFKRDATPQMLVEPEIHSEELTLGHQFALIMSRAVRSRDDIQKDVNDVLTELDAGKTYQQVAQALVDSDRVGSRSDRSAIIIDLQEK